MRSSQRSSAIATASLIRICASCELHTRFSRSCAQVGKRAAESPVLNHLDNAGSTNGAGGRDPAAWDDGKTGGYKTFRYTSYATPATDESEMDYLARSGRWPKNWEDFHPNPGHQTQSGDWASPFWGPDVCYQTASPSSAGPPASNAPLAIRQRAS